MDDLDSAGRLFEQLVTKAEVIGILFDRQQAGSLGSLSLVAGPE
jgi:hypothetical protein